MVDSQLNRSGPGLFVLTLTILALVDNLRYSLLHRACLITFYGFFCESTTFLLKHAKDDTLYSIRKTILITFTQLLKVRDITE